MAVAEFGVEGSVRFVLRLILLDDHLRAVCHYFQPSPPLRGGNFEY